MGILPGLDRHEETTRGWTVRDPTGLGEARNAVVVRAADVLVAIGGELERSPRLRSPSRPGSRSWASTRGEAVDGAGSAGDQVVQGRHAGSQSRVRCSSPGCRSPPTTAPAAPALEATISATSESDPPHLQAYKNGDIEAHNGHLAEDYAAIFPDGSLRPPSTHARRDSLDPMSSYALSELRVTPVTPDTALASYLADVEGPLHGNWTHIRWRVGEVWVKRQGEWKCRSYQPTPSRPPSERSHPGRGGERELPDRPGTASVICGSRPPRGHPSRAPARGPTAG